jgi:hypothetical protein
MSYTGHGTIRSHVATDPAAAANLIATRDILGHDHLGRTIVVVPKGQPIPAGLAVDPDATTTAPPPVDAAPNPEYLRRPEPDIGGQYATGLRTERALNLLRRQP